MASHVKLKMRQFWKWLDDGQTEEAVKAWVDDRCSKGGLDLDVVKSKNEHACCNRTFENMSRNETHLRMGLVSP